MCYSKFIYCIVLSLSIISSSFACSPAPDARPQSIHDKAKSAQYVFEGLVTEVNGKEVVITVQQYLKGHGTVEVTMTGFNSHSCSDFLAVGDEKIFFAEGEQQSTWTAIYDGAFGSTREGSPENFNAITAATECMAHLDKQGQLTIPCVAVESLGQIYQADLSQQSTHFVVNHAKLRPAIVKVVTKQPLAFIDSAQEPDFKIEIFPVPVAIVVKGHFNNGCGHLGEINTTRVDSTFNITIGVNNIGEVCTMALVPFETTIDLEVNGLNKGIYTVNVNNMVTMTFKLTVDNYLKQ